MYNKADQSQAKVALTEEQKRNKVLSRYILDANGKAVPNPFYDSRLAAEVQSQISEKPTPPQDPNQRTYNYYQPSPQQAEYTAKSKAFNKHYARLSYIENPAARQRLALLDALKEINPPKWEFNKSAMKIHREKHHLLALKTKIFMKSDMPEDILVDLMGCYRTLKGKDRDTYNALFKIVCFMVSKGIYAASQRGLGFLQISRNYIAQAINMATRTVSRAMNILEQDGIISRIKSCNCVNIFQISELFNDVEIIRVLSSFATGVCADWLRDVTRIANSVNRTEQFSIKQYIIRACATPAADENFINQENPPKIVEILTNLFKCKNI